jgi:hypothetical protein
MYAECFVRAGGNGATALGYVNALRYKSKRCNYINAGGLTMNFILDERARELHWEGHRRTDLVLFWKIHWRKLFMAMERWSFWRSNTQSFRDLFLFQL